VTLRHRSLLVETPNHLGAGGGQPPAGELTVSGFAEQPGEGEEALDEASRLHIFPTSGIVYRLHYLGVLTVNCTQE
jgi:hypothetical protein